MKYLRLFADQSSAVGQKVVTPNVAMLKTVSSKVLFVSTSYGEKAKLVADGDFIKVKVNALPNDEIWYTSSDGNVVTPSKTTIYFGANIVSNTYENGKGIIKFDGDVTSVGSAAFYDVDDDEAYLNLTSIKMPDSVTSIGIAAFAECANLSSIEISDSVTSIPESTFKFCASLTSIDIPSSVTSIGSLAFSGCTGLISIEIPSSVTSIGSAAFAGCSGLTSIVIGSSVTSIGSLVFAKCTSLTSITYKGTTTQWNAVTKGTNWHYNVPSTTVVTCTDGTVALD